MRRYGITHTLDQVFKAPLLVKHVLKDEAGINRTYVGNRHACLRPFFMSHVPARVRRQCTDLTSGVCWRGESTSCPECRQTQGCVEQLLAENRELDSVWTPDAQFRVRTSRYNAGARSQTVSALRLARLLSQGAQSGAGGAWQRRSRPARTPPGASGVGWSSCKRGSLGDHCQVWAWVWLFSLVPTDQAEAIWSSFEPPLGLATPMAWRDRQEVGVTAVGAAASSSSRRTTSAAFAGAGRHRGGDGGAGGKQGDGDGAARRGQGRAGPHRGRRGAPQQRVSCRFFVVCMLASCETSADCSQSIATRSPDCAQAPEAQDADQRADQGAAEGRGGARPAIHRGGAAAGARDAHGGGDQAGTR